MQNNKVNSFNKLLMMGDQGSEPEPVTSHKEENIIPPVGIANPELINLFNKNIGNEEKIKQGIKDVSDYLQENPLQTAGREVKSYGLRALEGLGGTVGGLMNLLSGEAHFDDQGKMRETEVPMMPSTSALREFTKEKTGQKYEPKTKFAKEAHEAISDVGASLPLPGGWFQKLVLPMFGQGAKALVKHQGGTEKQGDFAKLGFMMSSTIANIGNAPRTARNAYNEVINMMPQGTRMSTRYMQQEMNAMRNQPWFRTGRTTAKGPAMDEFERIENGIQHGSMDMHEALQIRRDINEARTKLGSFLYEPGMDKEAARQYLDRVDDLLRTNIERWGQANNPQWLQNYQRANQAYAVTRRSQVLQKFIESHAITKPLKSQTAKMIYNLGGAGAIIKSPALLGSAFPIAAGAKGVQILNRMFRSPILRNHYLEVLAAATAQNAGAMNRALQKFDKEAKILEDKSNKNQK